MNEFKLTNPGINYHSPIFLLMKPYPLIGDHICWHPLHFTYAAFRQLQITSQFCNHLSLCHRLTPLQPPMYTYRLSHFVGINF